QAIIDLFDGLPGGTAMVSCAVRLLTKVVDQVHHRVPRPGGLAGRRRLRPTATPAGPASRGVRVGQDCRPPSVDSSGRRRAAAAVTADTATPRIPPCRSPL